MFNSPAELKKKLDACDYLIDDGLATIVYLAGALEKPLLVEGPAGVGKTQLAIALAKAYNRSLVRLQCYEGIDAGKALYDWNYHRQLLRIQAGQGEGWEQASTDIFSREFLLERPLLQAILSPKPTVMLIDELDKSNEEFESFLLEVLAEFQITIPEIGTVKAVHKPLVILTSNSSRDFGDALRRRCLHVFIGYPELAREQEIVRRHVSAAPNLVDKGVELVQRLRKLPLRKLPSVAETIEFVQALDQLKINKLSPEAFELTAGTLLKYPQDMQTVREKFSGLLGSECE
ncbi:MAG TPA: MoxR family ATPase [Desulfobacteria bacterium]|nr:MoxR family ATPase [Desulfobacteria bacterium]